MLDHGREKVGRVHTCSALHHRSNTNEGEVDAHPWHNVTYLTQDACNHNVSYLDPLLIVQQLTKDLKLDTFLHPALMMTRAASRNVDNKFQVPVV